MKRKMWKSMLVVLLVSLCVTSMAFAQGGAEKTYPSRSIEIVVPSGAGGGQDTMVRFIQPMLEKELGVSIRVSNVSGGAHVKGIVYSHSAPADGYTLHCESPSGIIADIFKKMEFKFTEEFIPVANLQKDAGVIWTGSNGRFKNIQEVIAYAKDNPGKVTVSIASPGGVDDAGVGMFANLAGIELAMVPTESGGERMASVIGGHVDLMYEEVSAVGDMVASGHVKPILVFKTERINTPELKDVPCSGELGFAGLENLGTWRGFAVKQGTPQEAIDVLEAALKRVYDSAEYQKWAKENVLDITPGWLDAAGYRALWDANLKSYTEVFTKLGRL
ncbi:MAG: tripartite tricarboxylate transporter substrate binding protein [Sphaerochaetaceae bacterium]|nr:tripartite tricarboxylate transporter substrate binding protein [Sphaerochaetaceae bacterium]